MCWRQVSKFQKTVLIVLFYTVIYFFISFIMTPEPVYNFVSDDLRVGDKYVLIFLDAKTPVFSDVDGADVFKRRRCGSCFVTNNRGFLPMQEFDAVVHRNRSTLEELAETSSQPRYSLVTSHQCLEKKLLGCEPKVVSVSGYQLDLCSLCDHLLAHRLTRENSLDVI